MIHAETIYKNPTCKLVAVCDRDKKAGFGEEKIQRD